MQGIRTHQSVGTAYTKKNEVIANQFNPNNKEHNEEKIVICDQQSLERYTPYFSDVPLEQNILLAINKNIFPADKTVILRGLKFASITRFLNCAMSEQILFEDCALVLGINISQNNSSGTKYSSSNSSAVISSTSINNSEIAIYCKEAQNKQYFVRGYAHALVERGRPYEEGSGVTQNYLTATTYYKEAAKYKDINAMRRLAYLYFHGGKGMVRDYQAAMFWYQELANLGVTDAMVTLGNFYFTGTGTKQDDDKALKWYTQAADLGNVNALFSIGNVYSRGDKRNDVMAFGWYQKSAALGDTAAMCEVGDRYFKGCGVEKDDGKAIESYEKAARLGNMSAVFTVANCYYQGTGVQKDFKEAAYWYGVGVGANNLPCVLGLANYSMNVDNQKGIKRNCGKAYDLYLYAAKAGAVLAMAQVGIMLSKGQGVDKDMVAAAEWLKKAAKAGAVEANEILSKLLEAAQSSHRDEDLIALIEIEAERIGKIPDLAQQKKAVMDIGTKCFQILTAPREFKEDKLDKTQTQPSAERLARLKTLKSRAQLLISQLAKMSEKNYGILYVAIMQAAMTSIDDIDDHAYLKCMVDTQKQFSVRRLSNVCIEVFKCLNAWDNSGNFSILAPDNLGRLTSITRQLFLAINSVVQEKTKV